MNVFKTTVRIKKGCKILIAMLSFTISCLTSSVYALDPPPITPVDEFFVENTNGIPAIPDNWRLIVDGAVETPLTLTLEDLMGYAAANQMATLECMGNPFTPLILVGNANWTGVPLHTILKEVSPLGEAQSIIFHCVDGYRVHFGLDDMMQRDNDILAYTMNGETLPLEQGYPLRLVLLGNIGTTWAQWVKRIEMSTTAPETSFVPIPLHAQIFTPPDGNTLIVGTHTISGMAIVGEGREITRVEISTDGGTIWEPAQLLNDFVPDVWKHWEFTWEVSQTGDYQIVARAEDDLGNQQGDEGFFNIANVIITVRVDYDGDGDHIPDSEDNCPDTYNPDQEDSNNDGVGDVCELETTTPSSTTTTIVFIPTISSTSSMTTTAFLDFCMIEEIYGEHSEDAELLRYFRNTVLSKTPEGQEIIRLYYEWSPIIVKAMEEDKEFKEQTKEMVDGILPLIKELLEQNFPLTT